MRVKRVMIIISIIAVVLLSLSGVIVSVVVQIQLQMEKFGVVFKHAHIWNLYDLFPLSLIGLMGIIPLWVKLEKIDRKIEMERRRKL